MQAVHDDLSSVAAGPRWFGHLVGAKERRHGQKIDMFGELDDGKSEHRATGAPYRWEAGVWI